MPTPTKGSRLGGSPTHQKAILANLATNLFEHGSITTTETKARRLRPFAEKLITKAKRGDLHNRRQVLSVITDKDVVHVLFTEIGPRYAERPGGYTRITKIGPRKGDNAPMAVIELVEAEFTPTVRSTKKTASAAAPKPAPADTAEVEAAAAMEAEEAAPPGAVEDATAEVEEPSAEVEPVADQPEVEAEPEPEPEPEPETVEATEEAETAEAREPVTDEPAAEPEPETAEATDEPELETTGAETDEVEVEADVEEPPKE